MLYPKESAFREVKTLNGMWSYRFDWNEEGRSAEWNKNVPEEGEIPVPGSWNELFADDARKHFFGTCWYQTEVLIPESWRGRKVWLRVGSVHYRAELWINGVSVGEHEGCHLPFEFPVDEIVRYGEMNRLVIAVNGQLGQQTIPPGNKNEGKMIADIIPDAPQPDVAFDFFPYCGIHRPVILYTTAHDYISGLVVSTEIRDADGMVNVVVETVGEKSDSLSVSIAGKVIEAPIKKKKTQVQVLIPDAELWCPENPHLYDLSVSLFQAGRKVDEYTLAVGIRTIEVKGSALLLNGKPVYLKGFGKHEDFYASGRGLNLPVMKKDFELLKWIGANSFRTSHYPYAEETLDMADREGVLVISETPAVGIGFAYDMKESQESHIKVISELINRDRNHPSVIMWSLANEPDSQKIESVEYFKPLLKHARELDSSRPLTIVTCDGKWVKRDKCNIMGLCDVIVINRYYGWYTGCGRMTEVIRAMDVELDQIHEEYGRPVMIGEFGADSVAGLHSLPAMAWSEEYQAQLLEDTIKLLRTKAFVVGEHIWNFADFITGQACHRVVGNRKGVFTRERNPKLAAHLLRRIWHGRE